MRVSSEVGGPPMAAGLTVKLRVVKERGAQGRWGRGAKSGMNEDERDRIRLPTIPYILLVCAAWVKIARIGRRPAQIAGIAR